MEMQPAQRVGVPGPQRARRDRGERKDETGKRRLIPAKTRVRASEGRATAAEAPCEQHTGRGQRDERPGVPPPSQTRETERAHRERAARKRQQRDDPEERGRGAGAREYRNEMAHGAENERHRPHRQQEMQPAGAPRRGRAEQRRREGDQGEEYQHREPHRKFSGVRRRPRHRERAIGECISSAGMLAENTSRYGNHRWRAS